MVLVLLALRLSTPPRRRAEPQEPAPPPRPHLAPRAIGMVLFLTTFAIAAFASDTNGFLATIVLTIVFWLGGLALAAVVGDWYWAVNPFDTMAGLLFRRDQGDHPPRTAPPWTAAALLFGFFWFWFVYAFRVPSNTDVATFLGTYTVLMIVGAGLWGRGWIRHGEGFGAVFELLGRRLRIGPVPAGTAAVAVVLVGGIGYDGMSQTSWWLDVVGDRHDNALRLVGSIGLLWTTAIVGAAYLAAIWFVDRITDDDDDETHSRAELADRYGAALIPFGAACWLVHELPGLLVDAQNGIALASDPFGRGWDLFGTIDLAVDYQLLTPTQQAWTQIVLLLAGSVAAAVMIHRITFSHHRPQVAIKVIYPLATALVVATAGASGLLLGT